MTVISMRRWVALEQKRSVISGHIWGHRISLPDGHTITFRCIPIVTTTKTFKPTNESNELHPVPKTPS